MKFVKKVSSSKLNRINREITALKVRLADVDGRQIGIVSFNEALKKSEEIGLDLVEISPNSDPPVCRIMDYGKFIYKKNKSAKKQKKKQKITNIKEVKFRPGTDEGDYQIKLKNIIKFLNEGDKIKITLRFRGGEIVHHQIGIRMLYRIRDELSTKTIVESFPNKIEGRQITMVVAPKKNSKSTTK